MDQLKAELLSIKVVRASKDIYNQNISVGVKHIFKQVAHKFNEDSTNLKLRKKIHDFKCIMLLIRGQSLEAAIDKTYDRSTFHFKNDVVPGLEEFQYKPTPHVVFLTNNFAKETLLDFTFSTHFMSVFEDLSTPFDFKHESFEFMEHHNRRGPSKEIVCSQYVAKIQSTSKLLDIAQKPLGKHSSSASMPYSALIVMKPNQGFNVLLRCLKAIANRNIDNLNPLMIEDIRMTTNLTPDQI